MSNLEMLDMCVRFLIENHALVTDEHLEMLDSLWHYKYETDAAFVELSQQLAAEQPLPPSPPPEPELWACDWCGREWTSDVNACKLCGRDSNGVLPEAEEDYSCPNDDFCYASSIASDDYQEFLPEAQQQLQPPQQAQPQLDHENTDRYEYYTKELKKGTSKYFGQFYTPECLREPQLEHEDTDRYEYIKKEMKEIMSRKPSVKTLIWNKYFGESEATLGEGVNKTDSQPLVQQPHPQNQLVEPVAPSAPKKPHNPIYTNRLWPSPIAKVFVQQIRANNPWQQYRYKGLETWPSDFKKAWHSAGNTELKLTHDNCMRYLAYRMGRLTPGQLLEKTPREVHAKLIGQHSGVPGYYTKPFWY